MRKILIFALSTLLLTVSCKKSFFDLQRPPQSPWNNITEFERSIIGAYSICFDTPGGWQNSWVVAKLFKNDVADDMATSTPGDLSWGWYRDTKNNNKQIHNATFPLYYQTIAICNDALDFVNTHNGDPYPDMIENTISTGSLVNCISCAVIVIILWLQYLAMLMYLAALMMVNNFPS